MPLLSSVLPAPASSLALRLSSFATVALVFLLTGCTSTVSRVEPSRLQADLNAGWHFHYGDNLTLSQLAQPALAWTSVDLPHTWNARDGADGGDNYARGTGWYQRTFTIDPAWRGRKVFIEFDGASRVATVYLNGHEIGRHAGAFAKFRFDLTDALDWQKENRLVVAVNNAENGMPPISADFTFFGGLYRGVRLFAVDPVHIDVMDYASPGVSLRQDKVSATEATVTATTKLRNDAAAAVHATVRTVVRDAAGNEVCAQEKSLELAAAGSAVCAQSLVITQPHLWNGRSDPYLYTATVTLLVDRRARDEVRQPLGLRYFSVDPDKGFFLNGRHLDLRGASRHQDRAGKGWAISEADDREDFALLLELGSTAVRVAHYPQSDLWFDLADRHGIVTWAEIPVVNEVPATALYTGSAREQLRELIRQHYNHPSICFWGVGNETREMGEGSSPQVVNGPAANALIANLNDLAHEEDRSRPSTYASHHRPEDVKNFHTDLLGFNRYIGWYGGEASGFATWIDDVHKRYPALKLGISEYGAGANPAQHEANPKKPKPTGDWHPEEYQNLFHEVHWLALRDRDYVWCKFIWNLFDFAVDARSEGGTPGRNDKGLISYDRKLKKDAFFWYKANWSDEPVLHITSRRFIERKTPQAELKVYSNAREVEAFVNGISQGKQTSDNRIFRWNVTLAPGDNVIAARADVRGAALTDECVWHYTP